MQIEQLVVGQLQANCYLVWDEKTSQAIIIDPGDDGDFIIRRIQDFNLEPKLVIATHGHFDHVLAVTELKLAFNIPFLIHRADLFLLNRAPRTAQFFTGVKSDPSLPADKFIKEGDIIKFGKESLKVIETPGHTPGSICLYQKRDTVHPRGGVAPAAHLGGEGILFSGDTLFAQGVGRTDFKYASKEQLEKSIEKLLKLPPETLVYPGHEETEIIEEIQKRILPEVSYL